MKIVNNNVDYSWTDFSNFFTNIIRFCHRISATINNFSLRCSTFIELVLCDRLSEYRRNKADIQIWRLRQLVCPNIRMPYFICSDIDVYKFSAITQDCPVSVWVTLHSLHGISNKGVSELLLIVLLLIPILLKYLVVRQHSMVTISSIAGFLQRKKNIYFTA